VFVAGLNTIFPEAEIVVPPRTGDVKVLFVKDCVPVNVATVLSISKVIVSPDTVEDKPVPPSIDNVSVFKEIVALVELLSTTVKLEAVVIVVLPPNDTGEPFIVIELFVSAEFGIFENVLFEALIVLLVSISVVFLLQLYL
jgi:hypothetical protein